MTIFNRAVASVQARGFHAPDSIPDWMGEPLMMAQFARLSEEVGEVARSLRKGGDDLAEELADVVIVAAQMARLIGVDLEQAIAAKLTADEKRGHLHNGTTSPVDLLQTGGLIGKALPGNVKRCDCGEDFRGFGDLCDLCRESPAKYPPMETPAQHAERIAATQQRCAVVDEEGKLITPGGQP